MADQWRGDALGCLGKDLSKHLAWTNWPVKE